MLKLVSISIDGFKNLKVKKINFPKDGNILIIGKNESGKSTLFEAIFFALTSKLLVSKTKGYIDAIAYDKNAAIIELEFQKDGIPAKIRKTITKKRTGTSLDIRFWKNFGLHNKEPIHFSQTKKMNEIIENFLQFDEDVLLNSCFVKQKGLDGFIEETQSVRKKIVNRLLNLEKLTTLGEDYKKQAKALKEIEKYLDFKERIKKDQKTLENDKKILKELNKFQQHFNEIKTTEQEANNLRISVCELKEELVEGKNEINKLKNELSVTEIEKNKIDKFSIMIEEINDIQKNIQIYESKMESLEKEQENLTQRKESLEKSSAKVIQGEKDLLILKNSEEELLQDLQDFKKWNVIISNVKNEKIEINLSTQRFESEETRRKEQHTNIVELDRKLRNFLSNAYKELLHNCESLTRENKILKSLKSQYDEFEQLVENTSRKELLEERKRGVLKDKNKILDEQESIGKLISIKTENLGRIAKKTSEKPKIEDEINTINSVVNLKTNQEKLMGKIATDEKRLESLQAHKRTLENQTMYMSENRASLDHQIQDRKGDLVIYEKAIINKLLNATNDRYASISFLNRTNILLVEFVTSIIFVVSLILGFTSTNIFLLFSIISAIFGIGVLLAFNGFRPFKNLNYLQRSKTQLKYHYKEIQTIFPSFRSIGELDINSARTVDLIQSNLQKLEKLEMDLKIELLPEIDKLPLSKLIHKATEICNEITEITPSYNLTKTDMAVRQPSTDQMSNLIKEINELTEEINKIKQEIESNNQQLLFFDINYQNESSNGLLMILDGRKKQLTELSLLIKQLEDSNKQLDGQIGKFNQKEHESKLRKVKADLESLEEKLTEIANVNDPNNENKEVTKKKFTELKLRYDGITQTFEMLKIRCIDGQKKVGIENISLDNVEKYKNSVKDHIDRQSQEINNIDVWKSFNNYIEFFKVIPLLSDLMTDLKVTVKKYSDLKEGRNQSKITIQHKQNHIETELNNLPEKYKSNFKLFIEDLHNLEKKISENIINITQNNKLLSELDINTLKKQTGEVEKAISEIVNKKSKISSQRKAFDKKSDEIKRNLPEDLQKIKEGDILKETQTKIAELKKSINSILVSQNTKGASHKKSFTKRLVEFSKYADCSVISESTKLTEEEIPELESIYSKVQTQLNKEYEKINQEILAIDMPVKEGVALSDRIKTSINHFQSQLGGYSKYNQEYKSKIKAIESGKSFKMITSYLKDRPDCKFEKVLQERHIIETAVEILESGEVAISQKVLPETINNLARILPILTAGRYKDGMITEEYQIKLFDSKRGDYVEKKLFSGGTNDQIALAIRLAFTLATMKEASKNEAFIFLDEPLGFFDDERRNALIDFLTTGMIVDKFSQRIVISNFTVIKKYFDYIIELDNGQILNQYYTGSHETIQIQSEYEDLSAVQLLEIVDSQSFEEDGYCETTLSLQNISKNNIEEIRFNIVQNFNINVSPILFQDFQPEDIKTLTLDYNPLVVDNNPITIESHSIFADGTEKRMMVNRFEFNPPEPG